MGWWLGCALAGAEAGAAEVKPGDAEQLETASVMTQVMGYDVKQRSRFVESAVREMQANVISLQRQATAAKDAHQLARAACLLEKTSSASRMLTVMETSWILLQEAIQQGDRAQADHQLRKVVVAWSRGRQLTRDPRTCQDLKEGDDSGTEATVTVEGSDRALQNGLDSPTNPIEDIVDLPLQSY